MLAAALCAHAALAAEPLPLVDFFRHPIVTTPVMSPSGRHLAAAMKGGPQGRMRLVLLNLQDWSKSKVLASYADADIRSIRWVNDDRLVFDLTDAQSPGGEQWGEGLFVVDREGQDSAQRLIKRRESIIVERSSRRELSAWHALHSVLRDGSNDVIVIKYVAAAGDKDLFGTQLLRLDTVSGSTRALTQGGPEHAMDWALDPAGVPRAALSRHDGKTRLHFLASADAAWSVVAEYDTYGGDDRMQPLAVGRGDLLYAVAVPAAGADTLALMRLDLRRKIGDAQPLVKLDGHDFAGRLVMAPDGDLLGVHYQTNERGTHWFAAGMKAIQAEVDRLLPDTNNLLDCGDCADPAVVLVSATSDQQPDRFLLFDVKAGSLKRLADSRPWIRPQAMAERQLLHFAARDGLKIPVQVTRPPGHAGPAPMVMLVHGGPYARARGWAWDADTQFLASRGYVVVEPDFRGSTGLGAKHFRASLKQWGLAMQDDVADAALWAIKQGFADPRRVCIAGASYGGYATLMGLIRNPELFRCGVQWVGVTDLDLLYTSDWSDFAEVLKRYGLPVLIGDRVKDAAQLAATSPARLAAKLTQPLLMAYGGEDRRVPIEHGERMRDALRPHNPNVEWVKYQDEGHGWMLEANRVDYWSRVERFLDRHLKNPR